MGTGDPDLDPTVTPLGAPAVRVAPELASGATIGRYRVVEVLGRGGMGVVYAAHDPQLDRRVAVKVLQITGDEEQARLLREAQALAKLSHPNVVAVHDAGTVDGQVFVAMELVEGTTLTEWLETPRSWREVLRVMDQAGQGLVAAHAARLVHRDLKPDNVLLGKDGRARVADFGIARIVDEDAPVAGPVTAAPVSSPYATEAGTLIGTPAFMSPEQHAAESADASSDQYGFAATIYFALYGQHPFPQRDLDEMVAAKRAGRVRPPPAGARVPAWVRRHVLRGLSVRREDRFPTIADLLAALRRDPWVLRRRLAALAILAGGAAVAIVAWPRAHQAGPCDPLEGRLARAWGPERRAAVEQALPADLAAPVVSAFDARAREWRDVYAQTCKGPGAAASAAELALRADCLDRYVDDLGSLVELFEHPEQKVLERAQDIIGGIDPVSRCADAKIVRLRAPLPPDAATRRRIGDVQRRTALARAYADAGLTAKGMPLAAQVAAEAKAIGYKPLEAAALHVLGRMQYSSGELAAGDVSEKAAALAADLGGDPPTRVNALLNLAAVASRRHANAEARQLVEDAGALAEQLGDFPLRWHAQASRASYDVKWANRQRDQLALLDLAQKQWGPTSGKTAGILSDLFWAYYMPGSYAAALDYAARSVAALIASVGEAHVRTATAMNLQAVALVAVGRFDEGKSVEARSEAIFAERAKAGGDAGHASRPIIWYAQINMVRGRVDVALESWAKVLALVELDPTRSGVTRTDVYGDMAWLYLQEGRVADAAAALDRATQADPKQGPLPKTMPTLPLAQGELALAQNRPADAVAPFERTLRELSEWAEELEPGVVQRIQAAEAHVGLARALAGTDAGKSAEHAQAARAAYAELAPLGVEMVRDSSKRLEEWLKKP